jgi:hypothetical protein
MSGIVTSKSSWKMRLGRVLDRSGIDLLQTNKKNNAHIGPVTRRIGYLRACHLQRPPEDADLIRRMLVLWDFA